ncbi:YXWGXW repeat-containing protein [Glaciimonas immobilis]|uniref:YXWGXW repeat-containing protein n=1 Tax=Glaciimonas immobilis TaxID=728004 RepID=A0A840RUM7_9BURK|nr:YXWGXW repeat-containing protein [Glaciimonas immobilis]KAF3997243.1 BcpO-related WXXGXW repeat protein [Glaciimonas immobilis]MBB5202297.1 hypothetical protein [Glaciimonas immobilis]
MKFKSILCVSLLAASAGFMAPMTSVQAQVIGDVVVAPPQPRYEIVPGPRAGYVWAPGYWRWNGRRHIWVGGHYLRAHRGYRYNAPRWEHDPRGDWRFREHGWER